MLDMDGRDRQASLPRLVPVELGGQTVLVSVTGDAPSTASGGEREVSGRGGKPALEQVLDGLAVLATEIATRMRATDATRVAVEFGCDIAVESGSLVAVIGKASASSSIKVNLEWSGAGVDRFGEST